MSVLISNYGKEILNYNAVDGKVRVAIYARKSQHDDEEKSIDCQIAIIDGYIKDLNKRLDVKLYYNKEDIYVDNGKSGTTVEERDGFNALMSNIFNGRVKYGAVVTYTLDRFSRNLMDTYKYIPKLAHNNCIIITEGFEFDFTAESMRDLAINAANNEYYARNSAKKSVDGMINRAKQGKVVSSLPYGLKSVDKEIVVIKEEAKIIKRMYKLLLSGVSISDIERKLKSDGIVNRKGEPFTWNTIKNILTNIKMTGTYIWADSGKKRYKKHNVYLGKIDEIKKENAFEAIVDMDTFNKAQKILDDLYYSHYYGVIDKGYLLSGGKIICGICGAPLHGEKHIGGKNKKYKRYYLCPNHNNNETRRMKNDEGEYLSKCECKNINADYVEEFVKNVIVNIINDVIVNANEEIKDSLIKSLDSLKDEINSINSRLEEIDKKINNAINAQLNTTNDRIIAKYNGVIENLDTEIEELNKILEEKNNSYNSKVKDVSKLSEMKLTKELVFDNDVVARKLFSLFIDKIVLTNDDIKIILNDKKVED